jgi:hypothetical protein
VWRRWAGAKMEVEGGPGWGRRWPGAKKEVEGGAGWGRDNALHAGKQ